MYKYLYMALNHIAQPSRNLIYFELGCDELEDGTPSDEIKLAFLQNE